MPKDIGRWPAEEHEVLCEWPQPRVVITLTFPPGTEWPAVEDFLDIFATIAEESRVWGAWIG